MSARLIWVTVPSKKETTLLHDLVSLCKVQHCLKRAHFKPRGSSLQPGQQHRRRGHRSTRAISSFKQSPHQRISTPSHSLETRKISHSQDTDTLRQNTGSKKLSLDHNMNMLTRLIDKTTPASTHRHHSRPAPEPMLPPPPPRLPLGALHE